MANPIGARKNACFKAVSTAPSINKTPVGAATPPLPYPVFQDLSNSTGIVPSVRFNGDPAYVLDQTTQPSCKGDDPGTAGGVKSGTVNGEVKPIQGSCSVRVGGHWVIRQGDPCTMNSGNCPGIYTTTQTPSAMTGAGSTSDPSDMNPPIEPETAEENGWFENFWDESKMEMGQAKEHPVDGVFGAVKGTLNIPSEILNKTAEGWARIFALGSDVLGKPELADSFNETANNLSNGSAEIKFPTFKLSAAERGGDKIVTLISLPGAIKGLFKFGLKYLGKGGVKALGNESKIIEGADATESVLKTEAKAELEAAQTTKATGGMKVKGKETPTKPKPGSIEHKADRWEKYQQRGGEKSYEEWSKQYDINMRNYKFGLDREIDYRDAMGASEGTIKTPLTNRQIDILKNDEMYAGQLKTGPVSLTKENITAIQKDAELVKQGWNVEHILEKGASKPYLDALEKAGVTYKIGPQIP